MRTIIYLFFLFLLSNCKNTIDSEEQKAQDILKGSWLINDISDSFWKQVTSSSPSEGKPVINELTKSSALNGTFTFDPCDAKVASPRSPCKSSFIIAGISGGGFYYNDPKTYLDLAVIVPSEPGTQDYTILELEVMRVFSGNFSIENVNDNTLRLVLQKNVFGDNLDTNATITLKRK
jgi:hypothetical protein